MTHVRATAFAQIAIDMITNEIHLLESDSGCEESKKMISALKSAVTALGRCTGEYQSKPKPEKKVDTGDGCSYVFTSRAARAGEKCGKKTQPDCDFCSAHNKAKKPKSPETVAEEPVMKQKRLIITRNRKFSKEDDPVFWHSSSGFVVKSREEKLILARIVNDVMRDLDDSDLPELEAWKPYGMVPLFKEKFEDVKSKTSDVLDGGEDFKKISTLEEGFESDSMSEESSTGEN